MVPPFPQLGLTCWSQIWLLPYHIQSVAKFFNSNLLITILSLSPLPNSGLHYPSNIFDLYPIHHFFSVVFKCFMHQSNLTILITYALYFHSSSHYFLQLEGAFSLGPFTLHDQILPNHWFPNLWPPLNCLWHGNSSLIENSLLAFHSLSKFTALWGFLKIMGNKDKTEVK